MLISHYVTSVQSDLTQLGQLGDEKMVTASGNLAEALAPALRSRLFEVLDQLVADANADSPNMRLELRLAGDDVRIVRRDVAEEPIESPGDFTARFALRLPEEIKSLIDERASRAGASTNSWIVRALSRELNDAADVSQTFKGRKLRGTGKS